MNNRIVWSFLNIFSNLFYFLPMPFIRILWRLLDVFDGRFGAVLRYIVISKKLKNCGMVVYFGPFIYIDGIENLSIGNHVSIHNHTTLLAKGCINIGNNVSIAHHSSVVSANHTWSDLSTPIRKNPVIFEEVVIGDDVWLGCGVRILAGVTIESRTVVAAGAVVTKSLPGGSLYAGIPAKKIRSIQ